MISLYNLILPLVSSFFFSANSNKSSTDNFTSSVISGNLLITVLIPHPYTPGMLSDLSPSNTLYNKRFLASIPNSYFTIFLLYIFFLLGDQTMVLSSTNWRKSLSVDMTTACSFSFKRCVVI